MNIEMISPSELPPTLSPEERDKKVGMYLRNIGKIDSQLNEYNGILDEKVPFLASYIGLDTKDASGKPIPNEELKLRIGEVTILNYHQVANISSKAEFLHTFEAFERLWKPLTVEMIYAIRNADDHSRVLEAINFLPYPGWIDKNSLTSKPGKLPKPIENLTKFANQALIELDPNYTLNDPSIAQSKDPRFKIPKFNLPHLSRPNIKIPEFKRPDIHLPLEKFPPAGAKLARVLGRIGYTYLESLSTRGKNNWLYGFGAVSGFLLSSGVLDQETLVSSALVRAGIGLGIGGFSSFLEYRHRKNIGNIVGVDTKTLVDLTNLPEEDKLKRSNEFIKTVKAAAIKRGQKKLTQQELTDILIGSTNKIFIGENPTPQYIEFVSKYFSDKLEKNIFQSRKTLKVARSLSAGLAAGTLAEAISSGILEKVIGKSIDQILDNIADKLVDFKVPSIKSPQINLPTPDLEGGPFEAPQPTPLPLPEGTPSTPSLSQVNAQINPELLRQDPLIGLKAAKVGGHLQEINQASELGLKKAADTLGLDINSLDPSLKESIRHQGQQVAERLANSLTTQYGQAGVGMFDSEFAKQGLVEQIQQLNAHELIGKLAGEQLKGVVEVSVLAGGSDSLAIAQSLTNQGLNPNLIYDRDFLAKSLETLAQGVDISGQHIDYIKPEEWVDRISLSLSQGEILPLKIFSDLGLFSQDIVHQELLKSISYGDLVGLINKASSGDQAAIEQIIQLLKTENLIDHQKAQELLSKVKLGDNLSVSEVLKLFHWRHAGKLNLPANWKLVMAYKFG